MTSKTILAAVATVVLGLSAQAETVMGTWFNTQIGNYTQWPVTNETAYGGLWSGETGATLSGTAPAARLVLDTEASTPVAFTATKGKSLAAGIIEVESTISFTPFAAGTLPAAPTDSKAGVIAVKTGDDTYAFYGLKKDTTTNNWVQLSGYSPTLAQLDDVPVKVTLKKVGDVSYVNYTINDYLMTDGTSSDIEVVVGGNIATASFSGSGELSRLMSKAEIPMGTLTLTGLTGLDYTVASNMTAGTELDISGGSVQVPQGNAVRIYFAPKYGKVLTGAQSYLDIASMDAAVTIDDSTSGLPTVEDGKIRNGTQFYLTMAEAVTNAVDGDTLTLVKDVTGPGFKLPGSQAAVFTTTGLTLDLNGFTYTLNADKNGGTSGPDYAIAMYQGNKVVISNGTFAVAKDSNVQEFIRMFADSLTVKDVTFNAANINTNENYSCGVAVINGNVSFDGVSLTGMPTETKAWAVRIQNHAGAGYVSRSFTAANSTFSGDFFLAGGSFSFGENVSAPNAKYYYGGAAKSTFTASDVTAFDARVGQAVVTNVAAGSYIAGELYSTFDSAQAALASTTFAKTLTLLKAATVSAATTVAAGETYDIGTGSLTIATDTTLTLAGTLKCAEAGTNFVNNGTLAIQPGATVYMGATKWFGADAVFANVTAGTLAQTKSTVKLGNKYVISADGRATIFANETLFNAYDDEYYLVEGAEVTVPNVAEATVKARFNPVDGTKAILVKDTNVYYVGTAQVDPVPAVDPTAPATDVTNAIEQIKFTATDAQAKLKAAVGGSATKYNAFATWSKGVTGGQAAVVASAKPVESWILSDVSNSHLFANDPVLKIASLGAIVSGKVALTFSLKDGSTTVDVVVNAIKDYVLQSTDLSAWSTPTVTVEEGTVKVNVPSGSKAFMKVNVTK